MPKKIKIILNPTCNHGRSVRVANDLHPMTENLPVEWVTTSSPKQAVDLARSAGEQGCDLVVAAGGDGTVHEVINGLMQVSQKQRPALGIIPLGSGNDFAHILGIPDDPVQALQSCLSGEEHTLDMGAVRDDSDRLEFFNNTIGIGFDAVVTIHSRKITAIHGFLMYLAATLQTILRNFHPMDLCVETDQESWEGPIIMLTLGNGPREGGGFLVTPEAKLDDGILNYVSVSKISRLTMLRLVTEFMKGTQARFRQVKMGSCRTMNITSRQPLYIHCDGEIYSGFGTDVRGLKIEIMPAALRFMKAS